MVGQPRRPEMTYPSSSPAPTLSVVIPCYNECDYIESCLTEWSALFHEMGITYEFVVINDGSLDGSGRVLDKLRKDSKHIRTVHQLNSGHGRAVRRGYLMARGEWILQLDANGCFDTTDFQLFWDERKGTDLLVANRTHRIDSLTKRAMAKLLSFSLKTFYKVEITDPDASFRLFRRESVMPVLDTIPKPFDAINLGMTLLMKLTTPHTVKEVRIPFRLRPTPRGRTPFRKVLQAGFHTLSEVLRLKIEPSLALPATA